MHASDDTPQTQGRCGRAVAAAHDILIEVRLARLLPPRALVFAEAAGGCRQRTPSLDDEIPF